MNFSGGLTLIIHSAIIIFKWILKKPLHFIIMILVFIFFFYGFLFISKTSLNDSNLSFIKNYHSCNRDTDIKPDEKYIILRLDDVQSSYLRDLTIKMLNEGLDRNMPFTLAVIPLNVEKDKQMTSYLKMNSCNIEIAQHGFNNRNDIPEFQDLPEIVASNKFEQGLNILNEISKERIITFIPPSNVYSSGTAISAKKHKFKIISGEGDGLFDYSASTYDFDNNKLFSVDNVIEKSRKDAERKGFSIIMLHPQDYINEKGEEDPVKYKEYITLLDRLEDEGFKFTTMREYHNYLGQNGLAKDFYDYRTTISKKKNQYGTGDISIDLHDNIKTIEEIISKDNYIKKSEIIYFPPWIRNYNYITNDSLIIRGQVKEYIDAVYINGYKLTLFKPGDSQFNYILNNDRYSNLKEGKNTYDIFFETDGVQVLKETLVFFYNPDWKELSKYEENLINELKEDK